MPPQEQPANDQALKRLVALERSRGDLVKAADALRRHLDNFSGDAEGWEELADIYTELGAYRQARGCCVLRLGVRRLVVLFMGFVGRGELADSVYTRSWARSGRRVACIPHNGLWRCWGKGVDSCADSRWDGASLQGIWAHTGAPSRIS